MATVQGDIPTSEVLTLTADMIRDGKWITGGGWDPKLDGGVCLEGGLLAVLGIKFKFDGRGEWDSELQACPAYQAVHEYLVEKRELSPWRRLWQYNDQPGTTKQKVIRVLRTVARREKKKELASE